jgi:hypothetical protein
VVVLGVVLFAVTLFFAGMSSKRQARGPRRAIVAMGWAVSSEPSAGLPMFPVSVSV